MSLDPGTRFGPYEIVALLGAGGMGQVYRARDSKLNRDVAIKILPPGLAADRDRLMRAEREAQTLAALNHPNIAQIFGVVEPAAGAHETSALVMELVEGEDLAAKLARGPMAQSDALDVARQIAQALEAAHEAGIVHRDLKPANVKVRPDGTVKVLDFGLAKTLEPGSSNPRLSPGVELANSPTITSPATQLGVILGTAAYMAPEQARGRPLDKRADIWAFGCVLYEMLCGRTVFRGNDVTEIITSVMRDAPDWTALPAETPASVRRLLARCLERDPKRRLRDIGDALHEIDAAADGIAPPIAVAPRRSRWLGPVLWTVLGAVAGAIAILATTSERPPVAAPSTTRMTIVPPPEAPLRPDGSAPDLAITADGRRLVYQGRRSDPEGVRVGATQLVIRDLQSFDATPLPHYGFVPRSPFLSPDGTWVGFETTVGAAVAPVLAKAPLAGGDMVVLTGLGGLGPLLGASWGADGEITFATAQRATGLFRIAPTAGAAPAALTTTNREQNELDHIWPEVLPDNRGVLFTIVRQNGFDVAVLPRGSTEWRVVVPGGSAARYLSTGHVVYVADGTLRGVGFDLTALRATTDPAVLVSGVMSKPSGSASVAISPNGTLVYVSGTSPGRQSRLVWLSATGATALPLEPRELRDAALSPDARRVALQVAERESSSIWVYDIGRDSFTRVSPRETVLHDPVWSPDGTQLAAWSVTDKAIVRFAADGSGSLVTLVHAAAGSLYPHAWSPDGKTIAYVQELPSLRLMGVATAAPHPVRALASGKGAQVEASFSPDGKWIAHVSFDGANPEVVVGPVDSTDRRWPVATAGRWPSWSADGRALLFADGGVIHRVAIDPESGQPIGRPVKVLDLPPGVTAQSLGVARDGRILGVQRTGTAAPPAELRVVLNWFEELRAKIPTPAR